MQRIRQVMNTDVQAISPEATIEEAAWEMREGDFGVLPVVEAGELIGIITDRDIVVRAIAEGMDAGTRIRDAMSNEVVYVHEGNSLDAAAQLMSDHQIRRLPVTDMDGRLVGIVSLGDFAVESSDISPVMEALSNISAPS